MAQTFYTWPAPSHIQEVRVQKDFLQGNRAEILLPDLPPEDFKRQFAAFTTQLAEQKLGAYADVVDGRPVLCVTGFAQPEEVLNLLKEQHYTEGTPTTTQPKESKEADDGQKLTLMRRFRRFIGRNAMRFNAALSAAGHYASFQRGAAESRAINEIRIESKAEGNPDSFTKEDWEKAGIKATLEQIEKEYGIETGERTLPDRYREAQRVLFEKIEATPAPAKNKPSLLDNLEKIEGAARERRTEAETNRHSLRLLYLVLRGMGEDEFSSMRLGAGKNQGIGITAGGSLTLRTLFGAGQSQLKFEETLGELHGLLAEGNVTVNPGNWLGPERIAQRYTTFDGTVKILRENTTPITEFSALATDLMKTATGIDTKKATQNSTREGAGTWKSFKDSIVNPADFYTGITNLIGTAIAVFVPEKKKSIIPRPKAVNLSPIEKAKNWVSENPLTIQGMLSLSNKPLLLLNAWNMKDPDRRKWSLASSGAYTFSRFFNMFASKMGEAPTQKDVFDPLFAMTANTLLRVPEEQRDQALSVAVMALTNSVNASLAKSVHVLPDEIAERLVKKIEEVKDSPLFLLPPVKDGVVPESETEKAASPKEESPQHAPKFAKDELRSTGVKQATAATPLDHARRPAAETVGVGI